MPLDVPGQIGRRDVAALGFLLEGLFDDRRHVSAILAIDACEVPGVDLLDVAIVAAFPGRTLVVTGAEDPYASPAALAAQLDALPRARLEVVPGADHFFQLGLAEISRATAEFLGV